MRVMVALVEWEVRTLLVVSVVQVQLVVLVEFQQLVELLV